VLTELLWGEDGGGEFRLLAPVLSALSRAGKAIILVAPPYLVLAPALVQQGIDIRQILWVQPEKTGDRLWAAEQILKSANAGALLCWLPQVRPDQLRRLQLAANGSEGVNFIFRPVDAQLESSPAPLRLLCRPVPDAKISVEILKRRGPVASAPIILATALPPFMTKIQRLSSRSISSSMSADVVDRALPAAAFARSRVSTLA